MLTNKNLRYYYLSTWITYFVLVGSLVAPRIAGAPMSFLEYCTLLLVTSIGIVSGFGGLRISTTIKSKFFFGVSFVIWFLILILFIYFNIDY